MPWWTLDGVDNRAGRPANRPDLLAQVLDPPTTSDLVTKLQSSQVRGGSRGEALDACRMRGDCLRHAAGDPGGSGQERREGRRAIQRQRAGLGEGGALASQFVISIDRYNTDQEREVLATALKQGGYPAFLPALRKSPLVGKITAGKQEFNIRYAYQKQTAATATRNGRTIVIVTDKPVYFVGGGKAEAKPREGYEVAVAQFDVDDVGLGSGTMAMAARVKPGGDAGVQIDDYADKPVQLTTVRKLLK